VQAGGGASNIELRICDFGSMNKTNCSDFDLLHETLDEGYTDMGGTPLYMSPEMEDEGRHHHIGPATDVYR
jgi:hypothetical protein